MSTSEVTDLLTQARTAFGRRDWVLALERFRTARQHGTLNADDLYALANSAWWLGLLDEALPAQQDAYRLFLAAKQPRQAAVVALDTGYTFALRGEEAQASGWMSRAIRLLRDEPECPEQGFLLYLDFESAFASSDLETALERARAVHAVGVRFNDPNMVALGVLGQGRVLIKQGQIREGMVLLDEAMVAAVSDELDPGWAGNIYCHLMLACYEIADWRRSVEWTEATSRWCREMPGAGPFMGICRVHRAQTLQVLGDWDEAEREVIRVCEELAHFHVGIVAEAHYQLGELRRKRGDRRGAEAALDAAHRLGRDPQPCLALVRLAQGRGMVAASLIQRALAANAHDPLARARLLPAEVEIAAAIGDLERCRTASDELAEIARAYGTVGLQAVALHARGTVLLAAGSAPLAIPPLREALQSWQQLRAPYEVARVHELLSRAYTAIGDHDAAALAQDAARAEFRALGITHQSTGEPDQRPGRPDGLTPREAEILDMVATGLSNQEIASELSLSIRTVERHLATVYQKLGLEGRSARAAAVSHALRLASQSAPDTT